MSSTKQNPKPFSRIKSFFIFCAGASPEVLKEEKLREDSVRTAAIGAAIFMTGVLAWVSGGYAFYKIFGGGGSNAAINAAGFGFIWACFIFSMDRLIVMTIDKNDKGWKQFIKALPRFVVAIVIAITIAKPLELKIFSKQISKQVNNNRQNYIKTKKEGIEKDLRISEIKEEISQKREELDKFRAEFLKGPQTDDYEKNKEELEKLENRVETLNLNIQSNLQNLNQLKHMIRNNKYKMDEAQRIPIEKKMYRYESQIKKDKAEKNSKAEKITNLKSRVKTDDNDHRMVYENSIQELENDLKRLETQRSDNEIQIARETAKDTARADHVYSEDLITELQALYDLTHSGNTNEANAMWWTSQLIILLLVLIETVPVLTKLIMKKGPYDVHKAETLSNVRNTLLAQIVENRQQIIQKKLEGLNAIQGKLQSDEQLSATWKQYYDTLLQQELEEYMMLNSDAAIDMEMSAKRKKDQKQISIFSSTARIFQLIRETPDQNVRNEIVKELATKIKTA